MIIYPPPPEAQITDRVDRMVQLASYDVPVEGVRHTEGNVQATVQNTSLGNGTLYISESTVTWLTTAGEGLQLQYPLISLHAVSRDPTTRHHLLLHYDSKLLDGGQNSDSEEEDNEDVMTEVKFSPDVPDSLDAMFSALSDCQVLHPDSDCQLSDEDFEDADEEVGAGDGFMQGVAQMDGYFQNADGFDQLNEEGLANLARFNAMLAGGQGGQGDADLAQRTNQLTLANGHHDEDEEEGQFQDVEDMENQ